MLKINKILFLATILGGIIVIVPSCKHKDNTGSLNNTNVVNSDKVADKDTDKDTEKDTDKDTDNNVKDNEVENKKIQFTLDDNDYPVCNEVRINDNPQVFDYVIGENGGKIESIEVSNDVDEIIRIILPQGITIHTWIADPNSPGIQLLNFEKKIANDCTTYEAEGVSPYLQMFTFKVTDKKALNELTFKKVNGIKINDVSNVAGDEYENIDFDYELKIKFKAIN